MNNSMKMGSVKVTLFSILIALSGIAVIASAGDMPLPPNQFAGSVTLNGEDAFPETVINAFIDGDPRGTITVESSGKYGNFDGLVYMKVVGNASDDGKMITFTVCGAIADQTAVWTADAGPRILDLTAVDDVAPVVTDANANPSSIVADGVETTQLTVTVTDGCGVGPVTVDLSAIGGDAAREMSRVGTTDVYSVTVTAAEGTAGEHGLYVNASDVFGNCNTSVCIALEVVEISYAKGDLNHNGVVADSADVAMMLSASVGDIAATSEYDLNDNSQNADSADVAMMLSASVGDITL